MGSKFAPDIIIACVICVVRSSDSNYRGIIMRVSPLCFHSDYKEYHTDTTVRFVLNLSTAKMEEAEKESFKIESSINTSYYGKIRDSQDEYNFILPPSNPGPHLIFNYGICML